jgi:hypothetical protein
MMCAEMQRIAYLIRRMMRMDRLRNAYAPLTRLDLAAPPIGVKFSFFRPRTYRLWKRIQSCLCAKS